MPSMTAGLLLNRLKISEDEYNLSFWKGIHGSLRPKVEAGIIRKNTVVDLAKPQKVEKVMEALKDLFRRNRSDAEESNDSDSEDYFL